MSPTGERTDPHAAFRFAVQIDGIDEAYFSECDLPSLEVDVHEQKEGGYNTGVHLLPGPVKAGRITLRRGLVTSSALLKWYQDVANGKLSDVEKAVTVVMYDSMQSKVMTLNFTRAYPTRWSGPSFRTGENAVAIETMELAFAEVSLV